MRFGRSFVDGVLGALVMALILVVARNVGVPANLSLLLGTILGWVPSVDTWTLGFVMHALLGGVFGLVYAWTFDHVTHRATPVIGAAMGGVHAIVAGAALGGLPSVHAGMPEMVPAPGPFMVNHGFEAAALFVIVHVTYGAIVGGLHGAVRLA